MLLAEKKNEQVAQRATWGGLNHGVEMVYQLVATKHRDGLPHDGRAGC